MKDIAPVVVRLQEEIRAHNRELATEAITKAVLGVLFTLLTFAFVFWIAWFFGVLMAGLLNLEAWRFGAVVTGVFLVVSIGSAWRRVDPLAGLEPLSEKQLFLTFAAPALPGGIYFSPRHATAGAALVLLGGPANLFQALGVWAHRIRAEDSLVEDAARLLAASRPRFPTDQVRKPAAALLLRQLALIKIVPGEGAPAFALTAKGSAVLGGPMRPGKCSGGTP
jgi:hypothetical protein